ncbi:MAG: AAA family ATPase [archaeon]|jgi:adenylate kinase
MKLLVSGTPGCGKTTLAKMLGDKLKLKVINEKDFALKNSIGEFNEENELEIPLEKFEKKANEFLKKNDNILFEGHVVCEAKLKVDKVILITVNPEELEARLEQRNYSFQKIMDNVFCEGIDYCKKHVLRNYPKNKIILIKSAQNPKSTFEQALFALKK